MRNTIISLYQPSHLASLIPTMQSYIACAAQQLSSKNEQEGIDFSSLSLKLATDVIGEAAFGVDFGLTAPADMNHSWTHFASAPRAMEATPEEDSGDGGSEDGADQREVEQESWGDSGQTGL